MPQLFCYLRWFERCADNRPDGRRRLGRNREICLIASMCRNAVFGIKPFVMGRIIFMILLRCNRFPPLERYCLRYHQHQRQSRVHYQLSCSMCRHQETCRSLYLRQLDLMAILYLILLITIANEPVITAAFKGSLNDLNHFICSPPSIFLDGFLSRKLHPVIIISGISCTLSIQSSSL